MIVLAVAQILVRTRTLATIRGILDGGQSLPRCVDTADDLLAAKAAGRRVERAAMRLPFGTRCLAQAVATKWLLARKGIPSRLVIAVHRHELHGEHAFHAWVEQSGAIVIGHCRREEYAPVMSIG